MVRLIVAFLWIKTEIAPASRLSLRRGYFSGSAYALGVILLSFFYPFLGRLPIAIGVNGSLNLHFTSSGSFNWQENGDVTWRRCARFKYGQIWAESRLFRMPVRRHPTGSHSVAKSASWYDENGLETYKNEKLLCKVWRTVINFRF